MDLEIMILSLLWVFGITAIVLFTPKNGLRKLLFASLVCQAILWASALVHVKFGLLSFPVREFPKATDVLFTTEYFFYPLIYGFYIIFEPNVSFMVRLCYFVLWISGLTVIDYLIEKNTDLIIYENYAWYWSWLNFFVIFLLASLIYKWFFKDKSLFQADRWVAK
jgi:hypothetical protein